MNDVEIRKEIELIKQNEGTFRFTTNKCFGYTNPEDKIAALLLIVDGMNAQIKSIFSNLHNSSTFAITSAAKHRGRKSKWT